MTPFLVRQLIHLQHTAAAAWRNWCGFWFAPADPTLVGLQRLFAGCVLTLVLLQSTVLIPVLYAPDGMYDQPTADLLRRETPQPLDPWDWEPKPGEPPRLRPELYDHPDNMPYFRRWGVGRPYLLGEGVPLFSHLFHVRDLTTIYALHGVCIAVALCFAAGLGGRVTSVAAWLVALSYSHRANAAIFGMDTMLAITMLYLMISPSTAALSLDRLIASRRSGGTLPPPEPSAAANLALRCFQVHFCIIYLIAGLSKLQGPAWWNGDAMWQSISNFEFAPAKFAFSEDLLRWVARNRLVWELVNLGGCVFTLALEIALPFWIWYRRPRPWLMIGSVLMHTGIGLLMGLTAFGMLMMIMLAAFTPPEVVHSALGWLARRPRPRAAEAAAAREPEREMAAVG